MIRKLADWWKMRRDPVCRIVDLAAGMSDEELEDGGQYLLAVLWARANGGEG